MSYWKGLVKFAPGLEEFPNGQMTEAADSPLVVIEEKSIVVLSGVCTISAVSANS